MNQKELSNKEYEILQQVFHEMFDTVFVFLPAEILNSFYKRLHSK